MEVVPDPVAQQGTVQGRAGLGHALGPGDGRRTRLGIALAQAQFGRIVAGVGQAEHYVLAALILAAVGIRGVAWWQARSR